jgi:hypothetical protein
MKLNLFPVYDKAVLVIDGTHCEIRIPSDLQNEISYYSGYKHKHTQLYSLLIFMDFSDQLNWPGSMTDRAAFVETEMYNDSSNIKYFSEGELMLADGGFAGDGPILLPYNSVQLNESLSEKQSKQGFNDLFTESRALVEHAIHRLKARASCLVGRYNQNKANQLKVVRTAAILFNWTRRVRIKSNYLKAMFIKLLTTSKGR